MGMIKATLELKENEYFVTSDSPDAENYEIRLNGMIITDVVAIVRRIK